MFEDHNRTQQINTWLARLNEQLENLPAITRAAINAAIALASTGVPVNLYPLYSGETLLQVALPGMQNNALWTIPAWNEYVAGRHSTHPAHLCQCAHCHEARVAARVV